VPVHRQASHHNQDYYNPFVEVVSAQHTLKRARRGDWGDDVGYKEAMLGHGGHHG